MEEKIYVEVLYTLADGKRDEFYAKVKEAQIIESTRKEQGNEKYDWLFCPDDENAMVLLEIWETDAARKAHYEMPHYYKLAELKKDYVTNVVLNDHLIKN